MSRNIKRKLCLILAIVIATSGFMTGALRNYENDQRTVEYRNSQPSEGNYGQGITINPPPGYQIVGDRVVKESEYEQTYGYEQLTHGCDGNCITINNNYVNEEPIRRHAPNESANRDLNLSLGVSSATSSGLHIQPSNEMTKEFQQKMAEQRAIAAGLSAAVTEYAKAREREKSMREESKRLREDYKLRQQDNQNYANHLREQMNRWNQAAEKQMRENSLALFLAGTFLENQVDQQQMAEQQASMQALMNPLSARSYAYNEVAQKNVEAELQDAVNNKNYSRIAQLAESIYYDKNRKSVPDEVSQYFSQDGILLPEKIDPSLPATPFSEAKLESSQGSDEGQLVRRVMNEYQAHFAESNGLAGLSNDQKATYLIGAAAARLADEDFADGRTVSGYGLLNLAEAGLLIAQGFFEGAKDNVVQTAMFAPEIAKAAKALYENLKNDPQGTLDSAVQLVQDMPQIKDAFLLAINENKEAFRNADPYEMSKLAGSLTVDILVGVATNGGYLGVKSAIGGMSAAAKASKAAASLKIAASALPKTVLGRAPKIIQEGMTQYNNMSPVLRKNLSKQLLTDPKKALSVTRTHRALLNSGNQNLAKAASEISELALQSKSAGASNALRSAVRSLETPDQAVDYLKDASHAKEYIQTYEKMATVVAGRKTVTIEMMEGRGIPEKYYDSGKRNIFDEHDGMKHSRSRIFNGGDEGLKGISTGVGRTADDAIRVAKAEVASYGLQEEFVYGARQFSEKNILDLSGSTDIMNQQFALLKRRELPGAFRDSNILGHVMSENKITGVLLPSSVSPDGLVLHKIIKDR